MIGIVIVSHSYQLAQGVLELAREMAGSDVPLLAVGGLDAPDHPIGTDPLQIMAAIEEVHEDAHDGVLVIMDLGSALLSTEMALEMLPPGIAEYTLLCPAPLVEGALAAAVQARLGVNLHQAAAEAQNALQPKISQLNSPTAADQDRPAPAITEGQSLSIVVENLLGIHARPAARLVQTAARFPGATIQVQNLTSGSGSVSARSINGVTTLGVRQGDQIRFIASGLEADAALDALVELAANNFGDPTTAVERHTLAAEDAESLLPASSTAGTDETLLAGISVANGIAIGPVLHFRPGLPPVPETPCTDPDREWASLLASIEGARAQIQADIQSAGARAGADAAGIFEAHLLFLDDEALLSPTRAMIRDQRMNAAAAWMHTIGEVVKAYQKLGDQYLRTRARDVQDVGERVLRNLLGVAVAAPAISAPAVLVAPDLTTAEMAVLDPEVVLGILTAFGGPTSHAAIIARALGIPTVVGLGRDVMSIPEDALVILDGGGGGVWINPAPDRLAAAEEQARLLAVSQQEQLAGIHEPAVTRDGRQIEVAANISIAPEAARAVAVGAEGVGVFRTEYLFLGRGEPPSEDEQFSAYCAAAAGCNGFPLIIRTLDAGGDKEIPYLDLPREANPFLGLRGLRLCLTRPDLFKIQLRAAVRTAAEHPVKLMFPMVSILDEWHAACDLLDQAVCELKNQGVRVPDKIETGIMVEVPSAALLAEHFAAEVDFFSIGTNDLTQYLFAAERGNAGVAALSDALHPVVLKMIDRVVRAAHRLGKWVGVCGELAGEPDAIPLLVGLGVDELSMSAPSIPQARQIIRGLDYAAAQSKAQAALKLPDACTIRTMV